MSQMIHMWVILDTWLLHNTRNIRQSCDMTCQCQSCDMTCHTSHITCHMWHIAHRIWHVAYDKRDSCMSHIWCVLGEVYMVLIWHVSHVTCYVTHACHTVVRWHKMCVHVTHNTLLIYDKYTSHKTHDKYMP